MSEKTEQRFFDLSFEQTNNGTVRLTQTDCGEEYIIEAHTEQIKFIARQLCGINPEAAAQVADLERRISILTGDIEFIVTDKNLRRQIIDCEDGVELITRLDSLYDLALEFDGGRLFPKEAMDTPVSASSSAASATPRGMSGNETTSDFYGQLSLMIDRASR